MDEFHNLTDNLYINQIRNKINKQLYLSATPIKEFVCDHKYEYSWQDAINNKYICDFDIVIHENNQELYKFAFLLKQLCSDSLDITLIAKVYFMLKGMMYFGNRKCICYMTTIEKAKEMHKVLYWMSKLLNIEIDSWIITCNTAKTNRANYLYNFQKSNRLCVIINVHILDEGIDIPECDSVFITQPNNNIINIVQRMCRANRITENKTKCQIYLWCSKRKTNKILEYLSHNTNGAIDDKVIKFKLKNNKPTNEKVTLENYEHINDNIIKYDEDIYKYLINQSLNIPHDMIKIFTFYKQNNDNEIIIDFNLVHKWLDVRKDNLKRLLVDKFEENFDYTIKSYRKKQSKTERTSLYEEILITPNCMKELCMISQTAKAKEVRKYFIEMVLTR